MNISSKNHSVRLAFAAVLFCFILPFQSLSQDIQLAGGFLYGVAPTLTYDDDEGSGNVYSFFGDIEVSQVMGRFRYTRLIDDSLEGENSDYLSNGRSFLGALGYNVHLGEDHKFQVPLLATAGGVIAERKNFGDTGGMQIGFSINPQYFITEKLAIHSSLRILRGVETSNWIVMNQTDLSIGLRFSFL